MIHYKNKNLLYVFNIVHKFDSSILSAESPEFTKTLGEWLPVTGNWSVCWRATRDGNNSATFHERCDSKAPTLTVVKVFKDNKPLVFGGFATVNWTVVVTEGTSNVPAPGSFLFSFRNNNNLPPFKSQIVISQQANNTIFRRADSGPWFGVGPDLALIHKKVGWPIENVVNVANFGESYQLPPGFTKNNINTTSLLAGSLYFTPAEVEVLYLN